MPGLDPDKAMWRLKNLALQLMRQDVVKEVFVSLQNEGIDLNTFIESPFLETEESDPEDQKPLLLHAIGNSRINATKALLELGVDPNFQLKPSKRSALVFATRDKEILKIFLQAKGLNINLQDAEGSTILHEMCDEYIEEDLPKADEPTEPDEIWQVDRFQFADDHFEMIKMLLEAKADPNIPDANNRSPLLYAAYHGTLRWCKVLLEHGAHINCTSIGANTPLTAAALGEHLEVCKFLLEQGARVSIDKEGNPIALDALPVQGGTRNKSDEKVEAEIVALLTEYAKKQNPSLGFANTLFSPKTKVADKVLEPSGPSP